MRLALACFLGASLAVSASAQPAEATTADGRRVVLYEDGAWVAADAVEEPLREGHRLTSRTGAYELYVPTGWTIAKAKGAPVDGEFMLEHSSTGAAAFVSFLSAAEMGLGDLAISPESGAAMYWSGMKQAAAYAVRSQPRLRAVGGKRFGALEGEIRYPYEPTLAFQMTTYADTRGLIVLLTTVEPGELADARPTLDQLHRSLAIVPMEVVGEGEPVLQPRVNPD